MSLLFRENTELVSVTLISITKEGIFQLVLINSRLFYLLVGRKSASPAIIKSFSDLCYVTLH